MRKEFEGIPDAEAREIQMRQVAEDPILGPFFERLIETERLKRE